MGHLKTLYSHLPVWAQHGTVSAYGLYWHWLHFGPGHARYANAYPERERFTLPEWEVWQKRRLSVLLPAAVTRVPFYQKKWNAAQKSAAGRLQDLPLLEKSHIRAAPEDFLPGKFQAVVSLLHEKHVGEAERTGMFEKR